MLTALIGRTIIIIFGVLHPSYKTYKALRRKDYQEVVVLGMYWVVFSMFTTLELFTDIFFQWFPFYHELKILFVIWLVAPTTAGYSLIYRRLIHPELSKRENDIDEAINKATEKGYNKVVEFGAKGLNYAAKTFISTALLGHEFLTDQLRRRSSSMIELNRPTNPGNAINRHNRSRFGAGDHRDHLDGPYMFGSDPQLVEWEHVHSTYTANVNSGEDDPFALHWLQSGSTGSLGRQWKPPILKGLTDVPEDSEHPLETFLPSDTSATVTTQRRPHTISEAATGQSTRRVSRRRAASQPHGVKSREVNVH